MKNLSLTFQEEETSVKYEEYFFNGMPIPKDIQINDIDISSAKLVWNIDNNITNLNEEKMNYRVEIRKNEKNEKFKLIYEGNNKEYLIEKLVDGQNYEIRICLKYEDIIGPWSNIKNFQTLKFDSVILDKTPRKGEFLEKIAEWCNCKKFELLYRATRDGTTIDDLHKKM